METPKLPSPHLFKENADPVTPPRKQPPQKANTPSSAAATPLYKRFLGEIEGTEAGSRRGARSVSLDKGRRVGRVESPISNGILEIGPNGFYFSCEIPERKVARRLEDLEKDRKEGSPVRKGQGISTPTSMKKDARLMKRDVGSPGKKGVVRVGQTPMPTRKMRTPKIQRALPTRSGKLIAGRVAILPHECLAAKTAATIENGGKKQYASEERTFGPTKSKIQSPDQGVVETMIENDDPLLGSNTVDSQNQSPHPAEEDNGHPNRSRLLNGRSRTSAPRSNGRTGSTLPASKDSQEVQSTMETRLTQIKKVSFTPQKRSNSTARKLEKPVGTPKAVRNAIEEEMRLVCQSLSNSFGSKVFVGEKGNAILLPKSASYDSPVAMKATKLCPSVEKDSQRPLQRKTERVTRTGAASESALIASPFSQSTQTTPSKTEIKEKESYTPEGLPAKIFKSSGTNDPPSTRRLPNPKKPVFQNPVGGRRSALPLANPKHPANVSAKPGKSHYSATRTPSKEIQSALDQAIDAKIDEYKMAGREFTPSGNRVSELLEARERNRSVRKV